MSYFEFKNLSKSFDERILFENISFNFDSTGLIILLGESGSGKTTLFHILVGLESFSNGKILFNNKELKSEKDFSNFRNCCSFMFQEYGIVNYLSIKENLYLGGGTFKINNNSIISSFDIEKNAGLLSGGEKQRLALFKALIKNPKILFCDEPTGALDEENSKSIMELLKNESKQRLIILITHDTELANKYGDVVLRIKNKKLIKERTITNYIKQKNVKIKKTNYLFGILIAGISFFKEKWKMFFSLISMSLSLVSFIFLFSFKDSSIKVIEDQIMTYVDYNRIKVSEIENTVIEGTSFSIASTICPSYDNVLKLVEKYANVSFSYDALFVDSKVKTLNKELNPNIIICSLEEEISVNKMMFDLLDNYNINIAINKKIATMHNNKTIIDEVNYFIESKITKYYDEFSFFNMPCIFISNNYLQNQICKIELKNLSKYLNKKTTLLDRLTLLIDRKEELSSFCLNVDVFNKDDVIKVSNILNEYKKDNITYEASSRSLVTYNTLSSSVELLNILMLFFVVISLIVSLMLMFLVISSSFKFRLKEFALYKTYGISDFIFIIYTFLPITLYCLCSFLLSILGYSYLKNIISNILYPFFNCDLLFYSNEILKKSYILIVFLLFVAIIFTLFTLYKWKKIKVSEVIKSE